MNGNSIFYKSIERANKLLGLPTNNHETYLLLKVSFVPRRCHCLDHCFPETWKRINEYIAPQKLIGGEGNALIVKNGEKFVFESHESGPEIIAYLAFATASAALLKSIIDLAITIIKGFSSENNRQARIIISKKQVIKGKQQEEVVEIDLPLSEKALADKMKTLLLSKPMKRMP